MALTPIPEKVTDPKDAVLWSVYDSLQRIDEDNGSRMAHATTIAMNSHYNSDRPIFEFELSQIRDILKIPKPVEEKTVTVQTTSSSTNEVSQDITMREL